MSALHDQGTELTADAPSAADIVCFRIAGQLFGLALADVRDVLIVREIESIPLAQPAVMGALNLRGRIATVIELRERLALPSSGESLPSMCVVVEHGGFLYGLLVGSMDEILTLRPADLLSCPPTLPPALSALAAGVAPIGPDLLVLLAVDRLFAVEREEAA